MASQFEAGLKIIQIQETWKTYQPNSELGKVVQSFEIIALKNQSTYCKAYIGGFYALVTCKF